jgi:AbrB family looped-hinge helix DNA binding protein
MTTSMGQRGQIAIPKAIRVSRGITPGDEFDVIADEDDLDLILLRRTRPAANAGLVEHLAACPYKGPLRTSARRREVKNSQARL